MTAAPRRHIPWACWFLYCADVRGCSVVGRPRARGQLRTGAPARGMPLSACRRVRARASSVRVAERTSRSSTPRGRRAAGWRAQVLVCSLRFPGGAPRRARARARGSAPTIRRLAWCATCAVQRLRQNVRGLDSIMGSGERRPPERSSCKRQRPSACLRGSNKIMFDSRGRRGRFLILVRAMICQCRWLLREMVFDACATISNTVTDRAWHFAQGLFMALP